MHSIMAVHHRNIFVCPGASSQASWCLLWGHGQRMHTTTAIVASEVDRACHHKWWCEQALPAAPVTSGIITTKEGLANKSHLLPSAPWTSTHLAIDAGKGLGIAHRSLRVTVSAQDPVARSSLCPRLPVCPHHYQRPSKQALAICTADCIILLGAHAGHTCAHPPSMGLWAANTEETDSKYQNQKQPSQPKHTN